MRMFIFTRTPSVSFLQTSRAAHPPINLCTSFFVGGTTSIYDIPTTGGWREFCPTWRLPSRGLTSKTSDSGQPQELACGCCSLEVVLIYACKEAVHSK